jgi:hypothetical protein
MLKLILGSFAYCGLFHYAYVTAINPIFGYAHYLYNDPTLVGMVVAYACAVLPLACFKESPLPSNFGAALLYVLCYAPAQLMMLFMWEREAPELVVLQVVLAASMATLFVAARSGGRHKGAAHAEPEGLSVTVDVLTGISMLALLATFSGQMQLVSFEDVYDLRSTAAATERAFGVDYLLSWMSYSFLPYYFAKGFLSRNWRDLAIGIVGSMLLYAAMGSKAAILLGPIIFLVGVLYGSGGNPLNRLLIGVGTGVAVTVLLIPDDGIWIWAKSILLIRILGTGGWSMSTYYEFFTSHQFTYYTHVGPINAIFGGYPYGEYSLGQMIGLEYSGSSEANFNANFWASDGFAAMGLAGVPFATAGLGSAFYLINVLTRHCTPRLVVMWLTGFWLALLNLPLSVAVLSGGGLVTVLLIQAGASRRKPHPELVQADPPEISSFNTSLEK